jgi:homoserine dehydrogenase
MEEILIGLIGAGTVGGGVVKILDRQCTFFNTTLKLPVRLARIADLRDELFSQLPLDGVKCSKNADDIIGDPSISIVIELVGGTTFAREIVLKALNAGKHVVTANKALLAEHGPAIFETAERNNVSVHFEAAVGGGMPSIKTLRESLIGNEIAQLRTIINGTCNYILTQMTQKGEPFERVLKDAQEKGYAEADPTLDIGGGDSGHKVAIIASLIYGGYVPFESIHIEGIEEIKPEDIRYAEQLGYRIKLLGIIKRDSEGNWIDVRVHPAMIPQSDILYSVSDVYNALLIEGDAVGTILLYGKGAGEMPTASAVISDVIDAAKDILGNTPKRLAMDYYSNARVLPVKSIDTITSRYYLRFSVLDKPGVLARIASVLGSMDISIASVIQKEQHDENSVPVVILTHRATEKNLRDALSEIEAMDFIRDTTQVIRIEG